SLTIDSRERGDADDGTRFLVSEFRVTGGEHFSPSELEDLVADLAGAELTLAELQAAAAGITNHYRAHGFAVARAYLPAQEIVQGVVTIAVLEGTLGDHELENQSLVADARLNAVVAAANPQGEPIRSASVDRALLILSDMPGVARVAGSLSPGERVGTSNFV